MFKAFSRIRGLRSASYRVGLLHEQLEDELSCPGSGCHGSSRQPGDIVVQPHHALDCVEREAAALLFLSVFRWRRGGLLMVFAFSLRAVLGAVQYSANASCLLKETGKASESS